MCVCVCKSRQAAHDTQLQGMQIGKGQFREGGGVDNCMSDVWVGKLSVGNVRVRCFGGLSKRYNNNNNLRLIVVKTNHSTLHMVCSIQQSATQGSNDTTHRLSRRTAATTRFIPEGIGC